MLTKSITLSLSLLMIFTVPAADAGVNTYFPVPLRVRYLQLNQPFTLFYDINAEFYRDGDMARNDLKATLSYDGQNILYRTEDMDTGVTHTTIYNGCETYEIDSNSRLAEIEPGFDLERLECCPLPGLGLPKAPLFFEGVPPDRFPPVQLIQYFGPDLGTEHALVGESLYTTAGQNRDFGLFRYSDRAAHPRGGLMSGFSSVVTVQRGGQPMVLWYDSFENIQPDLGSLWEYYGHERFQGKWLATRIRMRKYLTLTSTRQNVLFTAATYKLTGAENQPLEKYDYDPVSYLPNHANIGDETGPTLQSFVFEHDRGSFESQRKKEVVSQPPRPNNP